MYASYNSLIHYFIAQKSSTDDVGLVQLHKTWTNYLHIKNEFQNKQMHCMYFSLGHFVH